MTVLEFTDVAVTTRAGTKLISNFTAAVRCGLTALIGRNGAGKSTLLRTIFGLHPLATGSISLDGIDPVQARRAFCAIAIFQPQNFSSYPEMSGAEFLAYFSELRGIPGKQAKARSAEWLRRVGLEMDASRPTGQYSQGMLQRLGLAYALQASAKLCVLDEPFAGIDPSGRAAMSDLVAIEARERIVLIATHHLDEMIERGASILEIESGGARLLRA